jgi:hypothetical protein
LRIQVGQLLPNGFINENSIYWQESPSSKDINANRIEFMTGFRSLMLDNLYFDDAVLTGDFFPNIII